MQAGGRAVLIGRHACQQACTGGWLASRRARQCFANACADEAGAVVGHLAAMVGRATSRRRPAGVGRLAAGGARSRTCAGCQGGRMHPLCGPAVRSRRGHGAGQAASRMGVRGWQQQVCASNMCSQSQQPRVKNPGLTIRIAHHQRQRARWARMMHQEQLHSICACPAASQHPEGRGESKQHHPMTAAACAAASRAVLHAIAQNRKPKNKTWHAYSHTHRA